MGENETMRLLHLPLKAKWYNMIRAKEKPEEYRANNAYWRKRLMQCYGKFDWCGMGCTSCRNCSFYSHKMFKNYTHVWFRLGYTKEAIIHPIQGFSIGRGNSGWGAPQEDVYIIKFDNTIEIKEVER